MSMLLKIKLTKIMTYTAFILAMAALIVAILNIFVVNHNLKPEEHLLIPVDCLKYSDSVNAMLDSMGVKGVKVLTPEEFDNKVRNYRLYIDMNSSRLNKTGP